MATAPFKLQARYREHDAIATGDDRPLTDRINSVIPHTVKSLHVFISRLRPGDQAAFDFPDLLQEMWITLWIRDKDFDPAKGKYITFAAMIVHQKLSEIRNRWNLVKGPRNTAALLRDSETESNDDAELERVRRTTREISPIEDAVIFDNSESDEETALRHERVDLMKTEVIRAIDKLESPLHYRVISCHAGLFREPMSLLEISKKLNMTLHDITLIYQEAIKSVRTAIILQEYN